MISALPNEVLDANLTCPAGLITISAAIGLTRCSDTAIAILAPPAFRQCGKVAIVLRSTEGQNNAPKHEPDSDDTYRQPAAAERSGGDAQRQGIGRIL